MSFEKMLESLIGGKITLSQASDMLGESQNKKILNYFINHDKISNDILSDGDLARLCIIVDILNILYNSDIGSPISDLNYDILQEMVISLGVPRLSGSLEINSLGKSDHKYTNLRGTLDKIYYLDPSEERVNKSRRTLDEWIRSTESLYESKTNKKINLKDQQVLICPKFDGVSCVLEIDGGEMKWLTRGHTRNNEASVVSHIMDIFNDLYRSDENKGIKFEVMMTEENFNKINELYRDKPYRNSRQIVTAIMNSNDPDFKTEYLYPVPLRMMSDDNNVEVMHDDMLSKFPSVFCKLGDIDTIREYARNNKVVEVNGMRFRTDGAVITLTNSELVSVLGRTNNINNFEVAYKFTEESGYTKVRDVEFYVSKFSYVTPVLVVHDIRLKGNTINHISLANIERFNELDLSYGDTIKVLYDIIPYATMEDKDCIRVRNGRKIEFTKKCPKCKMPLDLDVVEVQCNNRECPSRKIGIILNYCRNLRIQNIGYQTLEALEQAGLLDNGIRSLYKLKKKTYEIENLDGFGKLMSRKIVSEIESKRKLKDYDFFGSIGIETFSIKTFQSIFSNIKFNDFMNMIKVKNFGLMQALLLKSNGIGKKKAEVLIEYLKNTENRNELKKLLKEITIQQTYGEEMSTKGIIVFSGFRSDGLKDKLEKSGWGVSDTWTNKASYLIVPNLDTTSSKVNKAKKNGTPIIHRDEILDRLEINMGV